MKKFYKQNLHWLMCTIAIILVTTYWLFIATPRYSSESSIVLESPGIGAPTLNFQSLLNGGGNSRGDMLLLRDHLLSVDMLNKLEQSLPLRNHYSSNDIDWIYRLKDKNTEIENWHNHFLKFINVELDDYAQVLRIKIQAYTPEMANTIAKTMLLEGERHMNEMGRRLAEEQVRFLDEQVKQLKINFDQELQKLITFQNKSGLVSPQGELQSLSSVVSSMQSQISNLSAHRATLLSYQRSNSADVKRVDAEIVALKQQIESERQRQAKSSGDALNVLSSEYQILEMNMMFAKESYSGALAALQNTKIEAARKLKQVSVLQTPTYPEYATEPKRIYNATVFIILSMLLTLIAQMLIMIIKDHRD